VKKIVSIVILSVVLMHLIGFYVYFVVRQGQIRQEMRESIGLLPSEEFETFILTDEEYLQVRVNDHEVKINGRMYDHSKPKFENGKVILFARHDEAEDNLIGFLTEVVNSSSQDKRPVPSQLFSFFSLTFISQIPLALNTTLETTTHLSFYSTYYLNHSIPVESPPPRAIV